MKWIEGHGLGMRSRKTWQAALTSKGCKLHTHDEFVDVAPRVGTSCGGKDILIGLGLRFSSTVHK